MESTIGNVGRLANENWGGVIMVAMIASNVGLAVGVAGDKLNNALVMFGGIGLIGVGLALLLSLIILGDG